jgi:Domain of unknown function (DUF4340)
MSRQRLVMLLIAALLAISGAYYLSAQRNLARDSHGTLLFPTLAAELNSVTELSVHKGSPTASVTLHKQGAQWTVAERADYPADVAKLRRLLLALGEAKIVEAKTSNPASYAVIGVEDPLTAGASGVQVDLNAQDGKHALIVGKPSGAGNFVRRGGEGSSYQIQPEISVEAEPHYWIDTRLVDLQAANIQGIDVKPASSAAYSLRRTAAPATAPAPPSARSDTAGVAAAPPAPKDFSLQGVPAGRKASDPQTLAPSPTTYSGLGVDDVAPSSGIDFSKPATVTLTMVDGNVITFTGTVAGDKHWIQVSATKDAALNAKAMGRAFEISSFRYDAIFRPLESLLVPKPPPEAKTASGPVKLPGGKPRPPSP